LGDVGWGHDRSFGDVGSMSGLPESVHDWAIYEYTRKSRARVVPPARRDKVHARQTKPPSLQANVLEKLNQAPRRAPLWRAAGRPESHGADCRWPS